MSGAVLGLLTGYLIEKSGSSNGEIEGYITFGMFVVGGSVGGLAGAIIGAITGHKYEYKFVRK